MSKLETVLSIHPTALVCQDTTLTGKITLGAGSVIHPKASILALGGPIVIGRDCVVEEMSVIQNESSQPMVIGDCNMFMIASKVQCQSIGDHNTFHPRCTVPAQIRITDHCNIGTGTFVAPNRPGETEILPPYTVVYGSESSRRVWDGSGKDSELALKEKHVEYLREIIPKYNRMRAV